MPAPVYAPVRAAVYAPVHAPTYASHVARTAVEQLKMPTALVVGASRGLGFEFARQYADDGWRVLGTHRAAQDATRLREVGVEPIALDVLDADVAKKLDGALAEAVGDTRAGATAAGGIDIAVLNAGIHGPRQIRIDHPPSTVDFDAVMHTNVLAQMRLLCTLAPRLIAAGGTVALITSRMGSISAANTPNSLLYRVSKAAENMLAKAAHVELGPVGVRAVALHPGWVRTAMGGPHADVDAADSVAGMRRVLADAVAYPGGCFFDYRGESLAW